jgi:hypothetical protein
MADTRTIIAVKLVDPDTTGEAEFVALADDVANPTVTSFGSYLQVYDGTTWDRARGTSVDGLLVNLGTNNDVTVTGTVTVDTELSAAAALADDTANPTITSVGTFGHMYDGATWDRIRGTSVDGLLVNLGANNDVTIGVPAGETRAYTASTDTAAGASTNADTVDLGGVTKKLSKIEASAAVPFKVDIQSVVNGVGTTLTTLFGEAGTTVQWTPPHPDFFEVAFAANAGFDGFRLVLTNNEKSKASNLYGTLYTQD